MDQLLRKDLESPPFIRLPVKDYINCARLMKVNNEAIAVLKKCISEKSSLWTEVGILEKAIYKMKAKWRLEPLFRGTRQVLKCMKILKSQKILELITKALDSVLGLDGKTLVPSKQYLQFLLVKMIGVGKLAAQTIEYCMYTHSKLIGKIHIGHVLNSVMSFTAIVSRIWVLSHTLLVEVRTCYESIYSLHLLAAAADYDWLPHDVTLPDKFPVNVNHLLHQNSTCKRNIIEEYSVPKTASISSPLKPPSATTQKPFGNSVDVGVVISRDSFASSLAKAKKSSLVISEGKDGKNTNALPKETVGKMVIDSSYSQSVMPLPLTKKTKKSNAQISGVVREQNNMKKQKKKIGKVSLAGSSMKHQAVSDLPREIEIKKNDTAPKIKMSKKLKRHLDKKEIPIHQKFDAAVPKKKKKFKPH